MLLLAGAHMVALDVPWLRRLELFALDMQMRVRGPRAPGPEIAIVMIDDAAIAALGRWPVPRSSLAELVSTLHRAGARTIGIDVLLADAEPAARGGVVTKGGDESLARAIADAGNVVLPYALTFGGLPEARDDATAKPYANLAKSPGYRPLALHPTGRVMPLAAFTAHAHLGHILVAFDVDGAPRYDYPALELDVDFFPSMAITVAQHYLRVPSSAVAVDLGRGIRLGDTFVPTDASMRLVVDYLGPPPVFPTYGMLDVLDGKVAAAQFRDRIVLVGSNALGARDTFISPFTAVMPGVERLATVVDSIIHRRHVHRPVAAPWAEAGAMVAASLVLAFTVSRLSLAATALVALTIAAAFVVAAQVALARFGVWLAVAVPMLAVLATFTGLSLYRYGLLDRERRHIRRLFTRYLAPAMVDRVVASPTLPTLGGEQRELTILFCDVRGFTALSQRLPPDALTRTINAFLQAATDAVLEQGGTVDKYVGDAIMAFWNAPLDQPDHPALACRAALGIRARLAALVDVPPLAAGIGINTGLCTVGNFGSRHRFDYSAIGDAVNVAARLEGETRTHGMAVLLGPETARRCGLPVRAIGPLEVRGRAQAIDVYALVEDAH